MDRMDTTEKFLQYFVVLKDPGGSPRRVPPPILCKYPPGPPCVCPSVTHLFDNEIRFFKKNFLKFQIRLWHLFIVVELLTLGLHTVFKMATNGGRGRAWIAVHRVES
jgi:hypothetical protein